MSTVLEYIEQRQKLLAKIRSAKIGVGSNKLSNYYGAERRACQFRRAQWEIKLRTQRMSLLRLMREWAN